MTEAHADIAYDDTLVNVKGEAPLALVDADIVDAQRFCERAIFGQLRCVICVAVIAVFSGVFGFGLFGFSDRFCAHLIAENHLGSV